MIGWAMADHMRTELVTAALNMAVTFRGQRPPRVVFHADRGTQYTSNEMAEYAAAHGLACSVGRTGVCWDNAQHESYWASLKVEFYDRRSWATRAEAMTAVGDWIERVSNRRRRHSAVKHAQPRTVRATPSDGGSRLTRCPPSGSIQGRSRDLVQMRPSRS